MQRLQLSQQAAARELLRRRRARESLIDYSRYTNRAYRPASHHDLIADRLQAVERGEVKRLMIFMPPRHGKSELASRRFPGWFLGRNPARSVIAASYNSDLAADFGRDVRNLVASQEHRVLFPQGVLAGDSRAQDRWHTTAGGGYAAAGVGTAVTGRGAHLLLIDDPVKDREGADSELIREKTYRWYLSTAYTRLEGALDQDDPDPLWHDLDEAREKGVPFDGAVVLIQTRWHEDDLAGRLLADMARGADQWEVLSLPAIGGYGALWPEKYPLPRLEAIRTQLTPREWQSLYQQEPRPDEGTFFRREWFKRHDGPPGNVRKYIFTDFAVSEGEGDFTELGCFALDDEMNAYECGWWSGQATAMTWIEALIDMIEAHKPIAVFGETGPIRRAIEPILRRRMRERKVFCRLEWLTRGVDKVSAARPFQARAEMGMVFMSRSREASDVIEQAISFPAGKHDDKVDVLALLGLALDKAHPAIVRGRDDDRDDRLARPTDWGAPAETESWRTA